VYIPFKKISNKSRAWIYILSEEISEKNKNKLNEYLKSICEDWQSHGSIIKSSFLISKNRFILLFAEENTVSGCSIDASFNKLRKILNHLEIGLDSNSKIGIFKKEKMYFFDRIGIIKSIKNKTLERKDLMINTTVKNKEEYMNSWVIKIEDSWLNPLIK
tara:strand:- start:1451 stop:1930 length:480 start_codon:yes stop_codon:yes gene_type:complete